MTLCNLELHSRNDDMTIAFSQGHDMLILCSGEVYIEQNAVVKMVGCLSLVL